MRAFLRNHALVVLFAGLGALAALIGCDADNNVTPREGELQGTVYSKSGKTLSNVLVSWTYDPTRWGKSGTDGTFHVSGVGFGEQVFVAQKSGYRATSFRANIYSGAISTISKVEMETASFDYRNIKVEEVSATHAVISWQTTDYTNGLVEFGESDTFGGYVNETQGVYATTHRLTIPGLKAAKQYFFRIVASRQGRESETSVTDSFTTLSTLEDATVPAPPADAAIAVSEIPNQVTVFWGANTESDLKGYRIYRSELPSAGYSLVTDTLIAKGQERYIDTTVRTGMKYYYRVAAVDQAGNESGPSEIVSMVIPGEITGQVTWTLANSPFIIPGDLTVTDIGRLTIDPGVVVKMAEADSLRANDSAKVEIRVEGGVLIASTTREQPIIFTSDAPVPAAGNWGGITVSDSADTSTSLCGVTIAYADTGLTLEKALGTFRNVTLDHCTLGLEATSCSGLTLAGFRTTYSPTGMKLVDNTELALQDSSFSHGQTGVDASRNDTSIYSGNNFFDWATVGLSCGDTGGTVNILNNLFVTATGLGLRVMEQASVIRYNTFDAPYGIQVVNGVPIIEKNILVAQRSYTGQGFKGIENLGGQTTPPVFGPNDVYGFPEGASHIGCASASGSLASAPLFMKDFGGNANDYRLEQPFPASTDQWGIQRTAAPE
ncbi:MAG TPA: fibronectin type III domain-containing protein [Candidatus Ozemobacteraceae bacterium]